MTKKYSILMTALLTPILLMFLIWGKPGGTADVFDTKLPSQRSPSLKATPTTLRYNRDLDPNYSKQAAAAYYKKRQNLITGFHGAEQVDHVIKKLKAGQELIMWIGVAQRQETIEAVPLIAELLSHQDESVRRVAARALCWFGDKRGFDFVISQMEGPDSVKWWDIFEKIWHHLKELINIYLVVSKLFLIIIL